MKDNKRADVINTLLVLLWLAAMGAYLVLGRTIPLADHYEIGCWVDDLVPFVPAFVIPYVLWYVGLFYTAWHCLRWEKKLFRRFMGYNLLCYAVAIGVFVLFPTSIAFRPNVAGGDIFSLLVGLIYVFDKPTNVLPSLHVLLSLGIAYTLPRTKKWGKWWGKLLWWTVSLAICASTVLIKQHSVLDILAAIPISCIGYLIFFVKK